MVTLLPGPFALHRIRTTATRRPHESLRAVVCERRVIAAAQSEPFVLFGGAFGSFAA
jgi:hypothetical protein